MKLYVIDLVVRFRCADEWRSYLGVHLRWYLILNTASLVSTM
jgi:hypothetical protein